VVPVLPGFDGLTIHQGVGGGPCKRHRFADGSNALEVPLMCPIPCHVKDHLVPFGNQVLDRPTPVGEGGEEC
jgi:hypothetical protein